MFVWQKDKKILVNDKNQPDETNPITILDLENNRSELFLDGQSVTGGSGGAVAGVTSIDGQTGEVTLDDLGIKGLAKKDKVTDVDIDDGTISTSKINELDSKFTSIEDKLKNVKGIIRFKQSDVSSALAKSTTLLKTDLASEEDEPQVGNLAIFPDSKSLVIYIATITEVNGDSVTVSDPEYLKDTWVMSGEWIGGTHASYPEVYTYQGSTYLCIVSDTIKAPSKAEDKDWKIIAEKPAIPSYNDLPDKPEIPHPTYYKITGDPVSDMGNNKDYLISAANLVPTSPAPYINDVVVFYTNEATYIGIVKQKQNDTALIVTAKIRTGNGQET